MTSQHRQRVYRLQEVEARILEDDFPGENRAADLIDRLGRRRTTIMQGHESSVGHEWTPGLPVSSHSVITVIRRRALPMVNSDSLLSEEQRNSTTAWIEHTVTDQESPEYDRRLHLALYIITERKPSQ